MPLPPRNDASPFARFSPTASPSPASVFPLRSIDEFYNNHGGQAGRPRLVRTIPHADIPPRPDSVVRRYARSRISDGASAGTRPPEVNRRDFNMYRVVEGFLISPYTRCQCSINTNIGDKPRSKVSKCYLYYMLLQGK